LRRVLVGVALAAVLLLTIMVSEGNVYAPPVQITFSPNPPVAGQPFTITYSGNGPAGPIYVYSSSCSGVQVASGNGKSILVSGLTAGQYCVYFELPLVTTVFTVIPTVIPEYPYGLAVLAIFMMLGYGVVKRRTGTKKLA